MIDLIWTAALSIALAFIVLFGASKIYAAWERYRETRRNTLPELLARALHRVSRYLRVWAETLDTAIIAYRDNARETRPLLIRAELGRQLRRVARTQPEMIEADAGTEEA